jgi:GST-like protein
LAAFVIGDDAWVAMPHLKRLVDEITARPAAQRVAGLRDRYSFKAELDAETRRHLFPQNEPPPASGG